MRQLEAARFAIERRRSDPGYRLQDDPAAYAEVRDTLKGHFLKLCRAYVEDSLPLERALVRRFASGGAAGSSGRRDGSGKDRRRLRWSPRVSLGSRDYLGLKLDLRPASPSAGSRLSLGIRQLLSLDQRSFDLEVRTARHRFRLGLIESDAGRGDSISFDLRLRL